MQTADIFNKLKRIKTVIYIIERLTLCVSVLCVVVVFGVFLGVSDIVDLGVSEIPEGEFEITFTVYGQYAVVTFIGYLIFYQLDKIFEESIASQSVFLRNHIKRLRTIALMLVALMAFAFVCSLLVDALSNSRIPTLFNLAVDGCGLPTSQDWSEALSLPSNHSSGNYVATLNLLPLFVAIILWALSYVFEYGTVLQDDVDHTL